MGIYDFPYDANVTHSTIAIINSFIGAHSYGMQFSFRLLAKPNGQK
jgi:hypothetical protein